MQSMRICGAADGRGLAKTQKLGPFATTVPLIARHNPPTGLPRRPATCPEDDTASCGAWAVAAFQVPPPSSSCRWSHTNASCLYFHGPTTARQQSNRLRIGASAWLYCAAEHAASPSCHSSRMFGHALFAPLSSALCAASPAYRHEHAESEGAHFPMSLLRNLLENRVTSPVD